MSVRTASLCRQRGKYCVVVSEVPLRVLVMRAALGAAWAATFGLAGHFFCCDAPDSWWRIGWGRPKPGDVAYEPLEPHQLPRHSLAGGLWRLAGWTDGGYGMRLERELYRVEVGENLAREHAPDLAELFTEPSR